jgi:predicted Zn-dependent protease
MRVQTRPGLPTALLIATLVLLAGCGGDADPDLERVLALLHEGKQAEAREAATELSFTPPRSVSDRVPLARLLIKVENPRRAIAILKDEKLTPAARDVPALAYLRTGDRVRARREVDRLIDGPTSSGLTYRLRGEILFGDRDIEGARTALVESKRRDPADPTTWLVLAATWQYEGNLKTAEEILKEAAGQFPADARVQGSLAEVMLARWPKDRGVMVRAIGLLEQAVAVRPLAEGYRELLAKTRAASGDIEGSEREFEGICEQWPENPHHWNDLGMVRMSLNRIAEAVEAFEKAVNVASKPGPARVNIFLNLGNAQLAMADPTGDRLTWGGRAFKTFKAAQTFAPNDDRVMVGLAQAIVEMNPMGDQMTAAMAIYQRALKVNPQNFAAHLNIALLYYDIWMKDPESVSEGGRKALKHFRAAEAIQPRETWKRGAQNTFGELEEKLKPKPKDEKPEEDERETEKEPEKDEDPPK